MPRRRLGIDVVVHDEVYHELDAEELLRAFEAKIRRLCAGSDGRTKSDSGGPSAGLCTAKNSQLIAWSGLRKPGISMQPQYRFGLHYRADRLPDRNEDLVQATEEAGFNWFKRADMLRREGRPELRVPMAGPAGGGVFREPDTCRRRPRRRAFFAASIQPLASPAGAHVSSSSILENWLPLAAYVFGKTASRVEPATTRRVDWAGDVSFEYYPLPLTP